MKCNYLVTVFYSKDDNTYGMFNCSVKNQPKIKNIEDVETLQNRLMELMQLKGVVIINYKKF